MQEQDMQAQYPIETDTGGSPDQAKALVALAEVLSDPTQRPNFLKDPQGIVGPGYNELPQSVRDTFENMSQEELDQFAKTCDALVRAGFYVNFGGVRVCFF
jgi:hypothetical protein